MRCPPPGVGQELLLLAMPSSHSQKGRQTVWQEALAGFRLPLLGAWGLGPEGFGWLAHPPPSVLELLSKASRLISASWIPHSSWGPGGLGDVPRAGPLVKQFCELALFWEGPELVFRTLKRMPLLDGPWLGSWGGHVLWHCRKRKDR